MCLCVKDAEEPARSWFGIPRSVVSADWRVQKATRSLFRRILEDAPVIGASEKKTVQVVTVLSRHLRESDHYLVRKRYGESSVLFLFNSFLFS